MADEFVKTGIFFKPKNKNAPDWVRSKMSILIPDLIAYLKGLGPSEEWANFDICVSKSGKLYAKPDTWKPNTVQPPKSSAPTQDEDAQYDESDAIPF